MVEATGDSIANKTANKIKCVSRKLSKQLQSNELHNNKVNDESETPKKILASIKKTTNH